MLQWMLAGHIPYVDDSEGQPRVRVLEEHFVDGPITSGFISYPMSRDPKFQAEVAHRRRELELKTMDWGDVDVEALAQALAVRLAAVVPSACHVTVERAMIFGRDADGDGAGIDVAFHASFPESGSSAQRVRGAAVSALAGAQDELTSGRAPATATSHQRRSRTHPVADVCPRTRGRRDRAPGRPSRRTAGRAGRSMTGPATA